VNDVHKQAAWAILFDYFVAAPFVGILGEKFAEGEAERRTMYAQPGSFRFDDDLDKIEFRTLSGRVLLHPTLLYWAVGAMKMMFKEVKEPVEFLKSIMGTISSEMVYDTVSNHDVETAIKVTNEVYKLLPGYKEDPTVLRNPLGGGGGGTYSPFFFQEAARVFLAGNEAGLTFRDDMRYNWGFYEDYEPKHHAYWGIQTALIRSLDDDIFPMNGVLDKIVPTEYLQKKPIYTHPLNGGAKKYVTKSAASWLS
jgi:hypothetical protein